MADQPIPGVDVPDPTLLTADYLRKMLAYSPETGLFIWRVDRRRVSAGTVAGNTTADDGYVRIGVAAKVWLAHRLAWLWVTGEHPEIRIDHINGTRDDNRWINLRLATDSQNIQNQRGPHVGNTSGMLGVYWDKARQKYHAEICIERKRKFLGRFDSAEDAHAAYLAAKRVLHPYGQL